MEKLTGLIAAPFTPMNQNGELALEKIEVQARLFEKNGVSGAFICGSTGEGVSLTLEEKKQVMKRWGEVKGEKLKTIFMVGGTCLKEMQTLALYARDQKMDAIAALCPYYFKPATVAHLVDFCRQVAGVVPDLPFYYYHIPALTGGYFSMYEFLQMADGQIPNLAGIKFTHSDIMDFHASSRYGDGKYALLWGMDEAMLSGLAVGAKAAVGSTYNYAAPLYNQIIQAFEKGDLAAAQKKQEQAVRMVQLLVKYGGTSAGKGFMKIIGLDCGWFRPPLFPITDDQLRSLEAELQDIGFFEFCSKI